LSPPERPGNQDQLAGLAVESAGHRVRGAQLDPHARARSDRHERTQWIITIERAQDRVVGRIGHPTQIASHTVLVGEEREPLIFAAESQQLAADAQEPLVALAHEQHFTERRLGLGGRLDR
jgi:hypothetical protein